MRTRDTHIFIVLFALVAITSGSVGQTTGNQNNITTARPTLSPSIDTEGFNRTIANGTILKPRASSAKTDRFIVALLDGPLACFDAQGKELWRAEARKGNAALLASTTQTAVIADDEKIQAIDWATGTTVWTQLQPMANSRTTARGDLLISQLPMSTEVRNLGTGILNCSIDAIGAPRQIAVNHGRIAIDQPKQILVLDSTSGKILDTFNTANPARWMDYLPDGNLVVQTESSLSAFAPGNAKPRWEGVFPRPKEGEPALFFPGEVETIHIDGLKPTAISIPAEKDQRYIPPAMIINDKIAAPSRAGVYLLNKDGIILATIPHPVSEWRANHAFAHDGMLYIAVAGEHPGISLYDLEKQSTERTLVVTPTEFDSLDEMVFSTDMIIAIGHADRMRSTSVLFYRVSDQKLTNAAVVSREAAMTGWQFVDGAVVISTGTTIHLLRFSPNERR